MSPTWAMTRAWLTVLPWAGTRTSMSTTDPGRAKERYCAVAQIAGRPVVRSMAAIAAPMPTPPNMNRRPAGPTHSVSSSGRYQRWVLWVARRSMKGVVKTGSGRVGCEGRGGRPPARPGVTYQRR